ncbi:MAG: DNA mismatch repair endonuclease MutL [Verrucomicrobia bacterium]|nr:DNA mismatch repair endonuclease MutL [Verrucomicrobiota bacterium]MBU6446358.1 DNA mismatch repair endonuclease MutL [Verrucomicrobiota bacterium]MDE3047538.1 DNA mismatch repair endonuclease MutL [Verrucomicrobiota bacterium]
MCAKILKLPEVVINQIAAGEVVENPASIVKELIENSLDAGASRIDVEAVAGGLDLIRVVDDGCGMSREDALLCLERHATSKIQTVDDLQALTTMGFRGEALAAIASVSHFELQTSDGKGTRILGDGGKIGSVEPCARNRGTTVAVRSLFYNVPARKKFQKSQQANFVAISKLVETLAIAHPAVAFSFNDKIYAPATLKERIDEILGEHEHEVQGPKIYGFVASPAKAMAMRTGQYLYINHRPVFSPLLAKAVKEAFGTRIGEHAYPRFVLFLKMDPSQVDVNVHPQKREVRFRDESALFREVQRAIEEVFVPTHSFSKPLSFPAPASTPFTEQFLAMPCKVEEKELDWIMQEKPLAILGPYLLLQGEDLILVNLQAAHARVLFETLSWEKGSAQTLLWPIEIPMTTEEEERAVQLEKWGIECRILKKRLVVDALPPFLEPTDFPQFYAEWKEGKKIEEIATRFCRSLRKNCTLEQGVALWREVQKCKDRNHDPLGAPICKRLTEEDLDRWMIRA